MTVKCQICNKRRKPAAGAYQSIRLGGKIKAELQFRPEKPICEQCWRGLYETLVETIK